MSRFRKMSHSIWHCTYHIDWTPKYRYRMLQNNQISFEKLSTNQFNIGYKYSDFFKDFHAGLGFDYKKSNNAYSTISTIYEDVSYQTNILHNFGNENYRWNLNFDKYSWVRSKFKINASYGINHYFNMVNNSDIRENTSNTIPYITKFKK